MAEGRAFEVGGDQVAVFRLRDGSVRALSAVCPHRGGPLADGQIDSEVVICPLHLNAFELDTGCSTYRAPTDPQLPVDVSDGQLFLTAPANLKDLIMTTVNTAHAHHHRRQAAARRSLDRRLATRGRRVLGDHRPRAVARRNLIFSVLSEHIGFSVWSLWSVLVLFLGPEYGFDPAQKFLLTALPDLVGAVLRSRTPSRSPSSAAATGPSSARCSCWSRRS